MKKLMKFLSALTRVASQLLSAPETRKLSPVRLGAFV